MPDAMPPNDPADSAPGTDPPAALFTEAAGVFLPSVATDGPWYPGTLHGGPVSALLARAAEQHPDPAGTDPAAAMVVARLTVELLTAVPRRPLRVEVATERGGRRVQLVTARLLDDESGRPLALARAWRMRRHAGLELPEGVADREPASAPPESAPEPRAGLQGFGADGVELRSVGGRWPEAGPVSLWVRLRLPLVEGEQVSPLQRVACAADFGNSSTRLHFRHWLYPNVDLTISLFREPVGEWVCVSADSSVSTLGIASARTTLFDRDGSIGFGLQSLLVEPRG